MKLSAQQRGLIVMLEIQQGIEPPEQRRFRPSSGGRASVQLDFDREDFRPAGRQVELKEQSFESNEDGPDSRLAPGLRLYDIGFGLESPPDGSQEAIKARIGLDIRQAEIEILGIPGQGIKKTQSRSAAKNPTSESSGILEHLQHPRLDILSGQASGF